MTPTWSSTARDFARRHGLAEALSSALDTFASPDPRGGPPPPPEAPWDGDFASLEASLAGPLPHIDLSSDVTPPVAATFARRAAAADTLLDRPEPWARLLRVGYRHRLREILAGPAPRALRVRALADFYASQAAAASWHAPDAPDLLDAVASTPWRPVTHGVTHLHLDGPTRQGPVHLNALRIDPSSVRLQVVDRRAHADRPLAETAADAVAAWSGGFFLYSEPDIVAPDAQFDPVGLLVVDGVVHQPAALRRAALLVGGSGALELSAPGLSSPRWTTRAHGLLGPDEPSFAVTAGRVVARGRRLPVPLNGYVAPGDAPVGTPVRHHPPTLSNGEHAQQAVAGGPFLVRDGEVTLDLHAEDFWGTAPPRTFSQDETNDGNLLPRLALGLDDVGHLLVVAIDGRNARRAFGTTLRQTGAVLQRLGAHTAINLDGGSSKRLVVAGRSVDLSTTELVVGDAQPTTRRPVHTAVIAHAR
jgi:hypothetical protein